MTVEMNWINFSKKRTLMIFIISVGTILLTIVPRFSQRKKLPTNETKAQLAEGRLHLDRQEVNCTQYVNASKFITFAPFNPDQGLGNQMFMFAALFYVGFLTQREVVLFDKHNAATLESNFNLGVRKINSSCPCFSFDEKKISYDIRIESEISSQAAKNSTTILLHGLYQSWKYTQPVELTLRPHLRFKEQTETFARDFLKSVKPDGWDTKFTRVGIHNRRGNFVGPGALDFGLTTAPAFYFQKAMKYFVDRYEKVQFIVVSQDKDWSFKYIVYNNTSNATVNVSYSINHSAGQDMAILSLCDHVIMSTGTFSWWAAWLAKGTTIYYPHYPRNGSFLGNMINTSDYYPKHWMPIY